jgi:hypothetical protein
MNVEVRRVVQSPMNPRQWCLELACGHDVWVTAGRKPKAKTNHCPICAKKPTTTRKLGSGEEHERKHGTGTFDEVTNEQLDDRVLQAVREGFTRATAIHRHIKICHVTAIVRSLQRLRGRGRVVYDRSGPVSSLGWRIAEKGGK